MGWIESRGEKIHSKISQLALDPDGGGAKNMTALPADLDEILNIALAAVSFVVVAYCLYYFAVQYRMMRYDDPPLPLAQTVRLLWGHRLAFGTLVAFAGEFFQRGWSGAAHYLEHMTGHHVWMYQMPWALVPVAGVTIAIVGASCIARSIVPEAWGRFAYAVSISTVIVAVVATRIFR